MVLGSVLNQAAGREHQGDLAVDEQASDRLIDPGLVPGVGEQEVEVTALSLEALRIHHDAVDDFEVSPSLAGLALGHVGQGQNQEGPAHEVPLRVIDPEVIEAAVEGCRVAPEGELVARQVTGLRRNPGRAELSRIGTEHELEG